MAFRSSKLFPFSCDLFVKTTTNPTTLTAAPDGTPYTFGSPYLFGLTLEEVLFLLWRVKDVSAEGTWVNNNVTPPITTTISGASYNLFQSNAYGVEKMSKVACFDEFFFAAGFPTTNDGGVSIDQIGFFWFIVNQNSPLYFYENLYYLNIRCGIGTAGINFNTYRNPATGSVSINIGPFSRATSSIFMFYFFQPLYSDNLSMTVSLLSERAET